jgi:ABC-type Mn2+/Zn2+ transport system permease subunit
MYLVYNYYLHTDAIFLSFLSLYVRVSVVGPYLMEPNVFKVADAICHLLLLGCACALCVTSPLFAAVGGAVWRFSVFIFFNFFIMAACILFYFRTVAEILK